MTGSPSRFLAINERVRVPLAELRFTFSRSPGPGGQNVNKVNTQATLLFDLAASRSLTPAQRTRIRHRLAGRIDRNGLLRVVSRRHRTQAANRRAAIERFADLLADTLIVGKKRIATRVPRRAAKRRLDDKSRRSQVKNLRRTRPSPDE